MSSKTFTAMFFVLFLFLLSLPFPAHAQSVAAGDALCHRLAATCDFYFAGYPTSVPQLNVNGRPDKPMNRVRGRRLPQPLYLVSRTYGDKVGIVNSNNSPSTQFVFMKNTFPITNFANPEFSPSTFKPYKFLRANKSGVGHQTLHGTQRRFARYRCVRMYINAFQVEQGDGKMDNFYTNVPSDKECIVFKTY